MHTGVANTAHAVALAEIYNQGIEGRAAIFETEPLLAAIVQTWFDDLHPIVVVEHNEEVIASASSSASRPRPCCAGIVEFSIYVRRDWRGKGADRLAIAWLIQACEAAGFWKLVSRVCVENAASRVLLQAVGLREVGVYKKHGPHDGVWHDVVIVEYLLPSMRIPHGVSGESVLVTNAQKVEQIDGIEVAKPSDLASVLALLAAAGLPCEGLAEILPLTAVARDAGRVVGCAALEMYEGAALLRSVAIEPVYRSRGLGRQLVEDRLEEARRVGIQEVYLFTETAGDYFSRFGFHSIERSAVSVAIHASVEWTTICPISAQAMMVQVGGT